MDVTVLDKRGWTKHIWSVIFFWKRFTLQAVKTRPTCMLEAQADLYFSRPPTPGLCLINYTAFGGFQICVKLWLIGEFFKMCVNLLLSSHFLYDKNAKKVCITFLNLVITYKSAAAEQKLSIALVLADHEVKVHSWWLICNPLFTIVYMMSAMSIVMDSYSVKY